MICGGMMRRRSFASARTRRSPRCYSKLEKEDPEERKHRRAQFLIYKTLEAADDGRRSTCLGPRVCRMIVARARTGRKLMATRCGRLKNKVRVTLAAVHRRLWRRVALLG